MAGREIHNGPSAGVGGVTGRRDVQAARESGCVRAGSGWRGPGRKTETSTALRRAPSRAPLHRQAPHGRAEAGTLAPLHLLPARALSEAAPGVAVAINPRPLLSCARQRVTQANPAAFRRGSARSCSRSTPAAAATGAREHAPASTLAPSIAAHPGKGQAKALRYCRWSVGVEQTCSFTSTQAEGSEEAARKPQGGQVAPGSTSPGSPQ